MEIETQTYYKQKLDLFSGQQKRYQSRLSILAFIRLLLFVIFVWLLVRAIQSRFQGPDIWLSFITFVGFLAAVFLADVWKKKISLLRKLIFINENELLIGEGGTSLLDNGALFAGNEGYTTDLSVFGNRSLFHLLNRTGSVSGKIRLGFWLMHPLQCPDAIRERQAAVRELSGNFEYRQQLLAHTLLLKEEGSIEGLQTEVSEAEELLSGKFWSGMAVLWPIVGGLLLFHAIWSGNYRYVLLFGILGFMILSPIIKKLNVIYSHISKRSYLFGQYAACFTLISGQSFQHPYLVQQKSALQTASKAFVRLSKLVSWYDLRLSLFSFIINPLFFSDLLCARAYLRWQKKYQPHISQWFAALGEMESLNSLAAFHCNHPQYVLPEFITSVKILATGMGHPLMKHGSSVVNDVSLGNPEKLDLITGSNMSGKSTYLRTLGLNMILAQIGAPVYAARLQCCPVRILTSFHHIDSLEESTSYFFAELKCLKTIIDELPGSVPALVLLDEVMRGTNSKDKHDGTALLIKKLLEYDCLVCIATHDTELGVLADIYPGAIANYCFESELTGNGLHFDFTKKTGVAQTRNATYLMRQMGIV